MVEYKSKSYYRVHMEEHGDVALRIDKFDNLIYYYLSLVEPEKYKDCEKCGVPILITSGNKKYCSACARDMEKENSKARFRKWYHKQKSNDLEKPHN